MITATTFAGIAGFLLLAGIAFAVRWPEAVVAAPRLVLALIGAVTLAAGLQIVDLRVPESRIGVNPASEPLLPLRDPGREVYRQATLDFGSDDIYIVAMETEDGVFSEANLEALQRITNAIRRLEGVRDAESLTHVDMIWWKPDPGWVEVTAFIPQVPSDPAELSELRARALADPIYPKSLLSGDALTAAINVSFRPMSDAEFVELDLDGRIRALLEDEATGGRRFYVAGRPHLRAQAYHLMVGDLARLVPIAVAIAAAVLFAMTGSRRSTLLPLASCLCATLWSFGAMAFLGMDLNLITLVLAPMLICVGSVYGVHILSRYEGIASTSNSSREAALECLRYTRAPVVMAGATTCIGYGALQLADIQATNELGAFSVLGIAAVTLLSLTALPATLALLPLRRESDDPAHAPVSRTWLSERLGAAIAALLAMLADRVTRYPGSCISAWAVVALVSALLIPRIVVDTDVLTFFLPDSQVRRDFGAVNEHLTGAIPIYVSFIGSQEGTFREPESLRLLESAQAALEQLAGVRAVLSATDLVKLANQAIEEGDPAAARIPDTRAAVAETVFMLPKSRLRRFLNSNHSRANLIVRTDRSGSAAVLDLEARIHATLGELVIPEDLRVEVSGNAILINRSADGIAGNQAAQVGLAALAILLLVSLLFGSLRVGSLSMIPNVLPVIVFFGMLGTGLAPLSVPTSLIGSIALGIAIDDTVHFLVAYQRLRATGKSTPAEAARHCILLVGRPIVMTTVMLIVGFLVMLSSGFATLREFGYLTAFTMAICLLSDLVLLPALLVKLRA